MVHTDVESWIFSQGGEKENDGFVWHNVKTGLCFFKPYTNTDVTNPKIVESTKFWLKKCFFPRLGLATQNIVVLPTKQQVLTSIQKVFKSNFFLRKLQTAYHLFVKTTWTMHFCTQSSTYLAANMLWPKSIFTNAVSFDLMKTFVRRLHQTF